MKWYGFLLIFMAVSLFSNFMYTVRLDFSSANTLVKNTYPLPKGELQLLDRPEESVLSAQTMPKQPLILFFFASWCRPCAIELPVIVKLSARNDVPFIGVAVRDKNENIRNFLKKKNDPFQMIALDPQLEWTRQINAGKLPTAFIVNAKSEVVAQIKGLITEEFYLQTILPFLQELKNEKPL